MAVSADAETAPRGTDPIRMSVLNAVIEIVQYCAKYTGSSIAEAERVLGGGFAASTGHAYHEAAELVAALPGLHVPPEIDRRTAMRTLLRELTLSRRPGWAGLIPKGRGFVSAYLPPNAYQCLEAAGLYAVVPDAGALEWWDMLASHFRSDTDLDRTRIGREGERLTLAYETARLEGAGRADLRPKWVALDDNSLGYDVLSYNLDANGREAPLHIEVKASGEGRRAFFTRNEWKFADSMGDSFVVHFWNLSRVALTIVSCGELRAHIPIDQGAGKWQSVQLTIPDSGYATTQ
jgi:hypothetical protein